MPSLLEKRPSPHSCAKDNQTELPIEKHTTETAGYSDMIFALFDLLGLQFAPRLAGLPDRRLFAPGRVADTAAGRRLAHSLNLDLIREGWDEFVRCAASLKDGTVTVVLLEAVVLVVFWVAGRRASSRSPARVS